MTRLLIDTNIIIDLLAQREPFYDAASKLFSKADHGEITLLVSSLSFANTYYILAQQLPDIKTHQILRNLKTITSVLDLNSKIIDLSLNSKFKDFEDALQYFSGLENKADIIITRNQKDFKQSSIPVMNAFEFLAK